MKSGWQKYLLFASIVIVGGLILFETIRLKNTGFEGKTLWDWMELLIIPAVLASGAFYLNRSERAVERQIAEDRAKLEREIATDRQQETALQSYFDRMSELLLKEKLRTTKKKEVRDVARTRTLSITRVLNTKRTNLIIQFLREAKIIIDKKSILNDANMREMELQDLHLYNVYLQRADLVGANLSGAILMRADLSGASLANANLMYADLEGVNLEETHLEEADLSVAILQGANLQRAILRHADLANANLVGANLVGANLEHANLERADLSGALLRGAILRGANLQGAILEGAKDITEEQLAKVKTLKGAIMPDGTEHE